MSPVTERFLLIQPRTSHPKRYASYLQVLRGIQAEYDLRTLAEVDMAIWTLAHLVNDEIRDRTLKEIHQERDRDLFQRIPRHYAADMYIRKAGLKPVLEDAYRLVIDDSLEPNRLLLAECLCEDRTDPYLAMVTAGNAFEWLVWKLIVRRGEEQTARQWEEERKERKQGERGIELWRLIDHLRNLRDPEISKADKRWDRCKRWRNESIHPWAWEECELKDSPARRREFLTTVAELLREKGS
jgi:hypothetical protein